MTPVHPCGPSAWPRAGAQGAGVPEYLSMENVMMAPPGPDLRPVGTQRPGRKGEGGL